MPYQANFVYIVVAHWRTDDADSKVLKAFESRADADEFAEGLIKADAIAANSGVLPRRYEVVELPVMPRKR